MNISTIKMPILTVDLPELVFQNSCVASASLLRLDRLTDRHSYWELPWWRDLYSGVDWTDRQTGRQTLKS